MAHQLVCPSLSFFNILFSSFSLKIFLIILLKSLNILSYLNLSPFNNPTADYKHFNPFFTLIPSFIFIPLCFICDLLTALHLNSMNYLYFSLLTPLDASSIENLLLVCSPSCFSFILQFFSPFYFPISRFPFFYNITCHLPALNGVWFGYLCGFEHLNELLADLIMISSYFLIFKNYKLIFLLKPNCTFKNHLLFIYNSKYIGIYTALYLIFVYLSYIYNLYFIANINFIYWISVGFVLLYVIELKLSILKLSIWK